jgi:predicted DNA-binding protein
MSARIDKDLKKLYYIYKKGNIKMRKYIKTVMKIPVELKEKMKKIKEKTGVSYVFIVEKGIEAYIKYLEEK